MNILANTQYNVTTYLYGDGSGAAEIDTRITVTPLFDPTVTSPGTNALQPLANSYIINPGSVPTNFTIPLTQARNGWRYIHASLKADRDATDYTTAFDNMIAGNWTIETLWKTWQGSNVTGTVANGITTASGTATNRYYATLNIPSDIPLGNNCVIALKDTEGTVWWTWHLWITDYNPDAAVGNKNGQTHTYFSEAFTTAGLYYGKKMMDRNLGATITNVTDDYTPAQPQTTAEAVKWYGLMYQWGRKDPFTSSNNGSNAMGSAVPIYNADNTQYNYASGADAGKDMNGNNIIADANTNSVDGFPKVSNVTITTNRMIDAIRNPMNYYYSSVSGDWTKRDDNLWNTTTKTAFDPCPPGWRIPAGGANAAYNPWAGFGNGVYNYYNSVNYANVWGNNDSGPFPWFAQVTGQAGTAGRLYGATDNLGTTGFSGTADWYGKDKAWYPAAGFRSHISGVFNNTGSYGFSWSSAVTGTSGYYLFFYSANVSPTHNPARASSSALRCIQN